MRLLAPYNKQTIWNAIIESCEENQGKIIWRKEDEVYGNVRKLTGGGDFSIKILEEGTNTIISINYLPSNFTKFLHSLKIRIPNCTDVTEFQDEFCDICKSKFGLTNPKKEKQLTWHMGTGGLICFRCYTKQEKLSNIEKKVESGHNSDLLCMGCKRNAGGFFDLSSGSFCQQCSVEKFGVIILSASNGQYHGGHKAFIAGGYASKFELGHMYLTEQFFIFIKKNDNPAKRIEIIISLNSVQIEGWEVEEESRRKSVGMGGLAAPTGFGAAGIASGTVHDEGKAHHIVIPYVDENGIPQKPRFGISSFGGKAIREWSEKVYQQIVKVKSTSRSIQEKNKPINTSGNNDDPLHVLKLRFAKGEITKEEYEDMRKMLES